MAINPNTDFTAGAVLTAAQQNRFPRGVMAYNTATSAVAVTSEAVQITSSSFTAVASRYYKIRYYEPELPFASLTTASMRLRLTSISGTVLQLSRVNASATYAEFGVCEIVTTLTAGSTVIVATLAYGSSNTPVRGATQPAFLLVEDIGPA
jgi:hypothetical protein